MNILGETIIERRRAHARSYILAFVLSSPCFRDSFALGPNLEFPRFEASDATDKIDRVEEVWRWHIVDDFIGLFFIQRLHLSFLPPFQGRIFSTNSFRSQIVRKPLFEAALVERNDQHPYRDTRGRDLTTLTSRSKGARNIGGRRERKKEGNIRSPG